jgi:regulator of protease activity HflC (stomatin/prohibitin superfamily)
MEIGELVSEKRTLELTINELIDEFMDRCGVVVVDVDMQIVNVSTHGRDKRVCTSVKMKIEL